MGRRQVLTDADVKILLKIAEKEQTNKQLIAKKVVLSNTTAIYSLKKLEYLNLVKSRLEHEKNISRGRKTAFYCLTFYGILMTIYFWEKQNEKLFSDLDKIADKYEKLLPLVFGKWSFFSKNNLKEEAIRRLLGAVISIQPKLEIEIEMKYEYMQFLEKEFGTKFCSMIGKNLDKWLKSFDESMNEYADGVGLEWQNVRSRSLRIYESITNFSESNIVELLTKTFFFGSQDLIIDSKKETEFLKRIITDKEMKDYVNNYLTETEKRYEDFLKNIRSWKNLVNV